MAALELRHATKRFASVEIDASLRVERDRQLVLLGPSGCGKTTPLRMIAGLVDLDDGEVMFDGRSMRGVRPEHRNAAMVFQDHALFPFRTVAENVGYGLKIRKVPGAERAARVAEVLQLVQLAGLADRWPHELSGGQRQRVALARSIVIEPAVLLLDEPLSSLDPALRCDLQATICSLQQTRSITSVVVTHDRSEALAMADDLAVMIEGRIRQHGPLADVLDHPVDDDVAFFLGLPAPMGPGSGRSSDRPPAETSS